MRRSLPLFFLLVACGEKDFDQQYVEIEKELKSEAAKLDADMTKEAKKEPEETPTP